MTMNEWIESTMAQQILDTQNLVRIPSVSQGTPEPGKPFGVHVHDALTCALDMARRLGFTRVESLDGCCGIVDYGEGDEELLIMSHLDVVPAGTGWTHDPFGAEIADGKLFGRGAIDDKSPAVSSLYALAAVKESGAAMRRRVRLLFGCDEEVGWGCIERYKKTEKEPDMAFTPDSSFPLVNAEKNICQLGYTKLLPDAGIRIRCGSAANVIPDSAEATLPFEAASCDVPDGYEATFAGRTISVKGLGGHAAYPETAKNALLALLGILAQQDLPVDELAVASSLHALFDFDIHGEGLGLDVSDASGRLTLSPDILTWDEKGVTVTIDMRCPLSLEQEKLYATVDACFAALGFTRTYTHFSKGHYIPEDSELVGTLLSIYNRHTNRSSKPLSSGGGTYARSFENAVAFGVEPEGSDIRCHIPDEYISLEEMAFNTQVMAEAIYELAAKKA